MAKFWAKVERGESCWTWTGPMNGTIPQFSQDRAGERQRWSARRLAWSGEHGDVPADRVVFTTCGEGRCVRPAHLKIGTTADQERFTTEERLAAFWALVDRSAGPDECWPWQGKLRDGRYGYIMVSRRSVGTHVLAHELVKGPVPPGMFVCHRCDNPPCCNPAHLFIGTPADNSGDMVAKGRVARQVGLTHGQAKLTAEQVLALRAAWKEGASAAELGERFGIATMTAWRAATGKSYRDVS